MICQDGILRQSSLQRTIDPQHETGSNKRLFGRFAVSDEYKTFLRFEAWRFVFGIDEFCQGDEVRERDGVEARLRRDGRTGFRQPRGSFRIEEAQAHENVCHLFYGHHIELPGLRLSRRLFDRSQPESEDHVRDHDGGFHAVPPPFRSTGEHAALRF